MMKFLLLLLLLLTGCTKEQPEVPPVPAEETQTVEVPIRVIEEVEIVVHPSPNWRGSEIQQGPPVTPQPGDTADTYDPARAAEFPADGDCTDLQLLEKWLTVEGLTWENLDDRDCDQLVLVVSDGKTGTDTTCYSRLSDGGWAAEESLSHMAGFTGKGGIAHDRRRGSKQSPAGLWPLGSAFGLRDRPEGLQLPWREITEHSDWVGDSHSIYFNTWQERNDPALTEGWNRKNSEHLTDFDETYTYACVIGYNTPPYVVPERGFAIFFHVSDHPTTGCIALEEDDFLSTLLWMNPHRRPHILITGRENP